MTSSHRRLVGTRRRVAAQLDTWLGAEARQRRWQTRGRGLTAVALGGAVTAFVLGHPNVVFGFALLMAVGWACETIVERAPGDEGQLRLLRLLLGRLEVDAKAPLCLEFDLQGSGPWLAVGFLSPSGVRVTVRVERPRGEYVAAATLEQDGQRRPCAPRAVGRWRASGGCFVIDKPDARDLAELLSLLGGRESQE